MATLAANNPNMAVFGVICVAKDTKAKTRTRKTYIETDLVRLQVVEEDDALVAYGTERVPVSTFLPPRTEA